MWLNVTYCATLLLTCACQEQQADIMIKRLHNVSMQSLCDLHALNADINAVTNTAATSCT